MQLTALWASIILFLFHPELENDGNDDKRADEQKQEQINKDCRSRGFFFFEYDHIAVTVTALLCHHAVGGLLFRGDIALFGFVTGGCAT